jgi:hypothetical protein
MLRTTTLVLCALLPTAIARAGNVENCHGNVNGHCTPGPVLIEPTVHFIFWLPPGEHLRPNGNSFSDGNDMSLMAEFINDLGSTAYFNIVRQYCGSAVLREQRLSQDRACRDADTAGVDCALSAFRK